MNAITAPRKNFIEVFVWCFRKNHDNGGISFSPPMARAPRPFIIRDKYFYEAKRLGYRARSAFKLLEIQERYNLIRKGQTVLDVACAPGSFLQVLAPLVGQTGRVVGFDIQKVEPLGYPHVEAFVGDMLDIDGVAAELARRGITRVDLVTSDIAPATTGQRDVDQYRSIELNLAILALADKLLATGGNTILKVFVGEDVNDIIRVIKRTYSKLQRFKPHASRDRSFEEYFLCLDKHAKVDTLDKRNEV